MRGLKAYEFGTAIAFAFQAPTALLFVGEGTVRINPGPATERDQLRIFCDRPEMEERVRKYAAGSQQEALGDLLWALVNSSEFAMVR